MHIARYDWCIIDKVQETASVLSQDDLLLCSLDGGCKVMVVSLLELLASLKESAECKDCEELPYNVVELCFGHQALSFGADKLLLELDYLSTLRLLVLEFGNLVGNLKKTCLEDSMLTGGLECTLALWSRLGCTELSVLRICFRIPR